MVAVHSRELKAALFVAMSGRKDFEIVATATSTAELLTYVRAFRPDVAVVEPGLPGRPLDEVLTLLAESTKQVFLLGKGELAHAAPAPVVAFDQIDDLVGSMGDLARNADPGGST